MYSTRNGAESPLLAETQGCHVPRLNFRVHHGNGPEAQGPPKESLAKKLHSTEKRIYKLEEHNEAQV